MFFNQKLLFMVTGSQPRPCGATDNAVLQIFHTKLQKQNGCAWSERPDSHCDGVCTVYNGFGSRYHLVCRRTWINNHPRRRYMWCASFSTAVRKTFRLKYIYVEYCAFSFNVWQKKWSCSTASTQVLKLAE